VNVSGDVSLQRMAAGLSTHVFLFRLGFMVVPPERPQSAGAETPFSPRLSNSSMFLAALTSRFQKVALHRLLIQHKTFRVNLSTIILLASLEFRNFRILLIPFASFLDCCSFAWIPRCGPGSSSS
jgi:hypothetical protein